jgi:hypothetical protein
MTTDSLKVRNRLIHYNHTNISRGNSQKTSADYPFPVKDYLLPLPPERIFHVNWISFPYPRTRISCTEEMISVFQFNNELSSLHVRLYLVWAAASMSLTAHNTVFSVF